jgi:hypothetical protein
MEVRQKGKLIFVCGKMAAGKSTLSRELAPREDALLLAQQRPPATDERFNVVRHERDTA